MNKIIKKTGLLENSEQMNYLLDDKFIILYSQLIQTNKYLLTFFFEITTNELGFCSKMKILFLMHRL